MSPIDTWLDEAAKKENVTGVIVIDPANGQSLGVRGVAQHGHAPLLKRYLDQSSETPTKVVIINHIVYLTKQDNAIVGVYKVNDEPTE